MDWLDLLAIQGTLKSLLQYHSSKAPILWQLSSVVLEKTFESPLDCKEIKSVNSKGNQPRVFTERNDAEAEAPILWPPAGKSRLIRKGPDDGED